MTTPPAWILAAIFWLHMLATVTWIGSLAAINLLVLPASHRTLKLADQLSFIAALQKRLEPLAWFCMGLLLVTGLIQLSTSPRYDGFLALSTQWSLAILAKHLLGMIMVAVSAVQTWDVIPAIRRAIVLSKKTKNSEQLDALRKREINLLWINFWLSVLILGATAIARDS